MVDIGDEDFEDEGEELSLEDGSFDDASDEDFPADSAVLSAEEARQKAAAESPLIQLIEKIKGAFGLMKSDAGEHAPAPAPKRSTSAKPNAPAATGSPAAPAPAPEAEPYGDALMTVVVRNRFYRDNFRNLIRIVIVEAVIIVLLILSLVAHMYVTQPKDHYFATTADGRIMKLVPLNLPNMSTSALMSWVVQSATEVMTFGYHDYQRRLQESSRHFTRYGWETFTNALQRSRIIDSVEASRQVVTTTPRSAPVLVQEGVFNGKYRWVVDVPLDVTYKSATSGRTDQLMVRLVIDRVVSLENPNGVGIEQWIAIAK